MSARSSRPRKASLASAPAVTVLGTLNLDRIWQVDRLPAAGCTLLAQATRLEFGGKGANQAVAAARQGVTVRMIGAVGDDPEGRRYRAYLRDQHVDPRWVAVVPGVATGTAHVYVDARGQNQIIVDRGANARATAASTRAALAACLPRSAVLLVQFEGDLAAAAGALERAAAFGVRGVCNPSPVAAAFPWGDVPIDTVIVNEHECAAVFAVTPAQLARSSPARRRALLARRRVSHLIVTRGAQPAYFASGDAWLGVPTLRLNPVDTVGAGDTFAGVLAAGLARRAPWPLALRRASAAAALSTLRLGAQSAMPSAPAVARALRRLPRSA